MNNVVLWIVFGLGFIAGMIFGTGVGVGIYEWRQAIKKERHSELRYPVKGKERP